MFRTLLLSAFILLSACSDQAPTDSPETDAPNQADLSSAAPKQATAAGAAIRRVILAADPWCPHNCLAGALKGDAPDFIFPETSLGEARITLYTHPQSQWEYETRGWPTRHPCLLPSRRKTLTQPNWQTCWTAAWPG